MSDAAPTIRCTDVTRRYTDGDETVVALHEFTEAFGAGEMVAVTGPSGSGKSTLLALLAAIDYADEGTILVGETELGSLSTVEQAEFRATTVSYLYPEYNLLPMLTVYENISLALSLGRRSEAEIDARIRSSLERLELAAFAHRRPGALSSGQRARAALARAVATGTPVIVADEPTAHLDAGNALLVAELLAAIAREDEALVVIATHDPAVAGHATRRVELRTSGGA
ncbi:MAG: ABC transporter ATP-binding protein [Spirochaetota bacterium]